MASLPDLRPQMAANLYIINGAVSCAASRARTLGLDWEKVTALTDDALEERVYGPPSAKPVGRPLPDPAYLHAELRRVGVTLQSLAASTSRRGVMSAARHLRRWERAPREHVLQHVREVLVRSWINGSASVTAGRSIFWRSGEGAEERVLS